jgi:hypothetical protein
VSRDDFSCGKVLFGRVIDRSIVKENPSAFFRSDDAIARGIIRRMR